MEYIEYKKLNLKISKIGLGGIPIQNEDEKTAKEVIDACCDAGINYIDSARAYRDSEKLIGAAIKGRRDKFILATKSGAKTYEEMKNDINISLANFQTDYIDIYQLHNPKRDTFPICMGEGGAYSALLEAKKEGKIGHIGITNHNLDLLNELLDEGYFDKGIFESLMFPFNILEEQGRALFKKCNEKGILSIVMKPVAGGVIDDKKLAMKYLLNEECGILIPGMKSASEVKENSYLINNGYSALNDLEREEIKKIRKEIGNDFCRRCGYCAPCTKGIDIANCFVYELYYKKYNLKDWASERYKKMNAHASDCIECGACMKRCPYELNIIEKLKGVRKTFGE